MSPAVNPLLRPRPLNRPTPALDPRHMMTFQIEAPVSRGRWWRRATCAEVGCAQYLNGWTTTIDERTTLGQAQGRYIRRESGRGFTVARDEQGMTVFTFHPGQRCFQSGDHRVRNLDVPEIHVARGGDWRGNPTGQLVRHSGPGPWLDHLHTTTSAVVDLHNKG